MNIFKAIFKRNTGKRGCSGRALGLSSQFHELPTVLAESQPILSRRLPKTPVTAPTQPRPFNSPQNSSHALFALLGNPALRTQAKPHPGPAGDPVVKE